MSCKTVLLPIRASDVADSLMDAAIGVASRQGAHLHALFVHPPARSLTPYATIGLTQSMRETIESAATAASRDEAGGLRDAFQQRCAAAGLEFRSRDMKPGAPGADFIERTGLRSDLIARHGRLADLVVVPRPVRASPPPSSFEAAVRETGRAVLMLPRGAAPEVIGRNVVVGWNGSKEAARAVATALPYLGGSAVHVACSEKRMRDEANGSELVTYLTCHGVDARLSTFDAEGADVGPLLLKTCSEVEADLLVVGGYSHSRFRDLIMGGVTGHLLGHAPVPVLMVH
jgi:nucleotide-binding universal stress UspA family protein